MQIVNSPSSALTITTHLDTMGPAVTGSVAAGIGKHTSPRRTGRASLSSRRGRGIELDHDETAYRRFPIEPRMGGALTLGPAATDDQVVVCAEGPCDARGSDAGQCSASSELSPGSLIVQTRTSLPSGPRSF